MSDPNKIEVGDTVIVFLTYRPNDTPVFFEGVVLYTPYATGDCWHLRECGDGGRLRYVQTFAEMILLKKAPPFPG